MPNVLPAFSLTALVLVLYSGPARAEAKNDRGYVAGKFMLTIGNNDAGWVHSAEGGHASADVVTEKNGSDYYVKKHIGNVKYEDFSVELDMSPHKAIREWIEASWTKDYQRKSGSIVANDFRYRDREVRSFFNALIEEVTIPACDTSSKEPGYVSVKIRPELVKFSKESGNIKGDYHPEQKPWHPSNFRFEMGGLDTSRIAKIDSLTVKQTTVTDDIGNGRDYQGEPGKIDFPNLKVTLHESTVKSWQDWHDDFVIKGNNGDDKEKNGSLVFLSPNQREELMRVNLYQCGIFRLGDYRDEQSQRYHEASLYCERMQIQFSNTSKNPNGN